MVEFSPAIIVITYNRPTSLKRLLSSLGKAVFNESVDLVISIDFSGNAEVSEIADSFVWAFGNKRVIKRQERLGLKKHVLSCGDLSEEYGSVILLEDDLYVSPFFYGFAQKSLNYYAEDSRIAGISLYTHNTNIHTKKPFLPIEDDSDVYFLQFPSSWGQAWTYSQWRAFRDWYQDNSQITDADQIPANVKKWPDSSWLKHFTNYLVANDKFFSYPRLSLTTNFSDVGEHIAIKKYEYQREIQIIQREYRFIMLSDAGAAYDVYFEILPTYLMRYMHIPELYDCTIDLYGAKDLTQIKTKFLLSSHTCTNPISTFGRSLRPLELNVIEYIPGNIISLGEKNLFVNRPISLFDNLNYFFPISLTDLLKFSYLKVKNEGYAKIKSKFKK